MGEEPWRVHRAGAPSLDHIRRSNLLDRPAIETRLGLTLASPTLLALWHPVTIHRDTNAEADAFFAAMGRIAGQLLFVYPNADSGSYALIERTRALAAIRANTHIFVNLDAVTYWSLLGQVDVMVGNSSSGIMEAASFALPVVNVGMRQQGRERALNIIDAPAESDAICTAIDRTLSPPSEPAYVAWRILMAMEPPQEPSFRHSLPSLSKAFSSNSPRPSRKPKPVNCGNNRRSAE
jgi:UDP-N-acetylglucosamine 2-epimerase (non-hydrolysing)/GDP/UDP-N,N'-diacetylbacillosamine 2-epimerase (hydrolysing)